LGAVDNDLWGCHIDLVYRLAHACKTPITKLLFLADRGVVNCVAVVEINRMVFHKTLNLVQLFYFFAAPVSESRLLPLPLAP